MLLARITGFGGAGVSGLLFLFGVAAIFGNSLGGHGADRFAYARLMTVVLILLSLALLGFSLLVLLAGSALAVPGTLAVLALWGVAGFALVPLQQYRVVQLAPRTRNVALSLNASAIYLGQGTGRRTRRPRLGLRLAGEHGMDRVHLRPYGARGAPPHQQGEETGSLGRDRVRLKRIADGLRTHTEGLPHVIDATSLVISAQAGIHDE